MAFKKKLVLLYVLLVIFKIALFTFIISPSSFADGYLYSKMARSFFYDQDFVVHGEVTVPYPPLYSILLAPAYLFYDMEIVYLLMKVINALISSLIIIPAWLLGKEFLRKRGAFFFTVLVSILPFSFSTTPYIMSENLFYPLLLFFIYFLYKSFIHNGYRYDLLAGISLGLLLITRLISVFLLPVIFLVFVASLMREGTAQIKKKLVLILSFFIPVLIFFKSLLLLLGAKKNPTTGASEAVNLLFLKEGSITSAFSWLIFYPGFFILASGIVFFMLAAYNVYKNKDEKFYYFKLISLFAFIFIILLAINHNISLFQYEKTLLPSLLGRPLGRYIIGILPLIVLNGFMGAKLLELRKIPKKVVIPTSIILLASSVLVSFQLFPFNNISVTYVGIMKYIFEYFVYGKDTFGAAYHLGTVVFFGALFFITPWIISLFRVNLKKLFYTLFLFFILVNSVVFILEYGNSQVWYKSDQMQIGLWLNENDWDKISSILFDEDYIGKVTKMEQGEYLGQGYTVAGFWMNDEIRFDKISEMKKYDFVLTKKDLDKEKVVRKGAWNLYSTGDN